MTQQLTMELPSRAFAPVVDAEDQRIDVIVTIMRGKGWVHREYVLECLHARGYALSDRTMRALKEAAGGLIISNSQDGWKLATEATVGELDRAASEFFFRARTIAKSCAAIMKFRHRYRAGAESRE